MATVPKLLTYQEWLRLPPVEDGTDEVVKGELHFMPAPCYPHADIIQRIIRRFDRQVDEEKVSILGSTFGLMITEDPLTCRSPDLPVFWKHNRVIRDGLDWSPPDLIIEVISPSETKRRKQEKIDDDAGAGVPEVWLMSPEAQSVEVWLLIEGQLRRTAILVEGSLQPTRFPGVSIAIPEIWPEEVKQ
jgi:Uma2 family endonuclease